MESNYDKSLRNPPRFLRKLARSHQTENILHIPISKGCISKFLRLERTASFPNLRVLSVTVWNGKLTQLHGSPIAPGFLPTPTRRLRVQVVGHRRRVACGL